MKYWDQDIWIVNSLSISALIDIATYLRKLLRSLPKIYFQDNDPKTLSFFITALILTFLFISPHIIIDCGFILFSLINSHISTKNI